MARTPFNWSNSVSNRHLYSMLLLSDDKTSGGMNSDWSVAATLVTCAPRYKKSKLKRK